MPLTPKEAKRASEIEELASKRQLSEAELVEYHNLAALSHSRAILQRQQDRNG